MYSKWMALPLSTKGKLAQQFGIPKNGAIEVYANTIKSDGFLVHDIENALTLDSMQKFLGTEETDVTILWDYLINKIENRTPKIEENIKIEIESIEVMPEKPVIPPFCDKCDSKGVRHKKGCPKFK